MKRKLMLFLTCLFISVGLATAQTQTITGTVISDEDGQPVVGASVSVKGTTIGTITNIDGNFTLSNVPSSAKTLQISFIGMITQEVAVKPNVRIALKSDNEMLDEVVVVAYGTAKKSSFTGSVNVVGNQNIKDINSPSFEKALQGAAPGVSITQSSGQPGAKQSILLRGISSVNASTEPLYVIDGVPVMPENLSVSGVNGSPGSLGISSLIRTSDIESISILKDAAATSMYGSRGANGVIMITTKSGRQGRTDITLKTSIGFNDWAVKNREVLSGDQFRELMYESLYNYYVDRGTSASDIPAMVQEDLDDTYPIPENGYSNWEKALFRDRGFKQNYEVSVSGGSDKTTFFTSLGLLDELGKVDASGIQQYGGRLNLNHEGKSFRIGTNISITKISQKRVPEGTAYANPYYATRNYLLPTTPIYNSDGSYYLGTMLGGLDNLVRAQDTDSYKVRLFNMRASVWGEVDIYDNLKFKQTISYNYSSTRATTVWGKDGRNGGNYNGLTIKLNPESSKVYSSSILSYAKSIGLHNADIIVGWDAEKERYDLVSASGNGFLSPALTELGVAAEPNSVYSAIDNDRMLSFLSRINYNYDNKYYATVSYRKDGSSRFGSNKRWGTFWSLSGSWRLSSENFMKSVSFVDDLKVRASLGDSGTLPGGYYYSQSNYNMGGSYMGNPAAYPARIANPDLSWEVTRTWDIGVEAKLFDRLSVEFDLYLKNTKDLIATVPISKITGFSSYVANMGKMQNKGFELILGYDVFKDNQLYWNTRVNFARNINKVTEVYGGVEEILSRDGYPYITRKGLSYFNFYSREYAGVNPETGAEQWYTNAQDENGNYIKEITENPAQANRIALNKKGDPSLTGGWLNTFQYKGIELSALVSFSFGGHFYDEGWSRTTNGLYDFGYTSMPAMSQYKDRWQNPGDKTSVGRRVYAYSYGNYASSKWIYSSDHARLKNISLSYTLPSSFLNKVDLKDVRFIVSGSNLLTWQKTPDFDPEVPFGYTVGYALPNLKDITFGVEIKF